MIGVDRGLVVLPAVAVALAACVAMLVHLATSSPAVLGHHALAPVVPAPTGSPGLSLFACVVATAIGAYLTTRPPLEIR